jgi:hypothetical protein
LAGTFTWIGGLAYTLVVTVAWAFQFSTSYSVAMELMDREEQNIDRQYAYICDNELFYNIGRGAGILIIVLFALLLNVSAALRWAPLVVAVLQLPMAWVIYLLSREHRETVQVASLPQTVTV